MLIGTAFLVRAYTMWFHRPINPFGSDFFAFWTAARLVVSGQIAQVYDLVSQALIQAGLLEHNQSQPFFYPPTFLMIIVPFGLLPLHVAMFSFALVTGMAYVWAATRVSPWAWIPALACPAVALNLLAAQNGMLTAAIVGTGLMFIDRRPRMAGLLFGAMVIKPHIALILPLALLVTRRWQVLIYTALSGVMICLASAIIFGWDVWYQFLTVGTHTARQIMETGTLSFYKIKSAFGLARLLGVPESFAYAAQMLSAVIAISTLVWALRREVPPLIERSLIIITGLLVPPYMLHYDMVVMVFPCLWFMNEWVKQRHIPLDEGLLVILTFLTPVISLFFPIDLGVRFIWLVFLIRQTLTATAVNKAHPGVCHA
jgi:hypothetical protein